jgi:hypothetical protein
MPSVVLERLNIFSGRADVVRSDCLLRLSESGRDGGHDSAPAAPEAPGPDAGGLFHWVSVHGYVRVNSSFTKVHALTL